MVAVFRLARVNEGNGSLGRSSKESLGWWFVQIHKDGLPLVRMSKIC